MSYSYRLDKDTHLHVNSDLSGCVIFRDELLIVQIDKETLLEIVSNYVLMQRISHLEQQEPEEILGLKKESR